MTLYERWHIDRPMFHALLALAAISLIVLYSAGGNSLVFALDDAARLGIGFIVLFATAQVPPETYRKWSVPLFAGGVLALAAVLAIGVVRFGARRWIAFGPLSIQPSEFMKLAVPMMLAWFFSRRSLPPRLMHVIGAALIMLIPVLLIAKEPDLGTAVIVLLSGVIVLFLAGMSWRTIAVVVLAGAAAAPLLWAHMHHYQRQRIYILFHPEADPLGAGYHAIQGMIAVGSGGLFGQGWLHSSQANLHFLPDSTTDFAFAVFCQEFGLTGDLILLALYLFIIYRGLRIAFAAQDSYSRLLAGSLSVLFFFDVFINMGMVSGILPVVGVPLPLLSYGGTSLLIIMAGLGILMSIHGHRRLVS
ncbi:MAG: rod shape-determining protein RodA [Gammaproteobacteria bacterium]|nr:rod shape-determining protein RodA [Gammaproteobacteria bacterium]